MCISGCAVPLARCYFWHLFQRGWFVFDCTSNNRLSRGWTKRNIFMLVWASCRNVLPKSRRMEWWHYSSSERAKIPSEQQLFVPCLSSFGSTDKNFHHWARARLSPFPPGMEVICTSNPKNLDNWPLTIVSIEESGAATKDCQSWPSKMKHGSMWANERQKESSHTPWQNSTSESICFGVLFEIKYCIRPTDHGGF